MQAMLLHAELLLLYAMCPACAPLFQVCEQARARRSESDGAARQEEALMVREASRGSALYMLAALCLGSQAGRAITVRV